jgi:hypothetical protein
MTSRNLTPNPLSGTVLTRATAGVASLALAMALTSCSFSFGELEPVGGDATPPADTTEQVAEDTTDDAGAVDPVDTENSDSEFPMDPAEALTWAGDTYWLSGTGTAFYRLDWSLSSSTTLQLTHSGSSNFIIETYGADGNRYASLVNEIGAYEGPSVIADLPMVDGPEAVSYVYIRADGAWTIAR